MANETTENELNQPGEPGTEYFMETLPGQDRYVAPLEETQLQDVDSVDESAPATSMWADAWRTLRRNPLFIISGLLIIFIIVVAIAPGLFTKQDPNACDLGNSLSPSTAGHPFGFDLQGCDVYTRVVYGTRTSLSVGVLSTLLVVIVGTLIGAVAGFFGGWIDAVLSRITDIFFALPMLLGAIVVLQMFKTSKSIWKIVLVLTREQGYRKHQEGRWMKRAYDRYFAPLPSLRQSLRDIPERYNRIQEELDRLEAEGRIFIIRPDRPVEVSRLEQDVHKIQALYDEGRRIALEQLPALKNYLELPQ